MGEKKSQTYQIGQMIRLARMKKGLSQLELARRLGYRSGQMISRLERGCLRPPAAKLGALAKILDIPVGLMFEALLAESEMRS